MFLAVLYNLNKSFFIAFAFVRVFFQAAVVLMNLGAVVCDMEQNYGDRIASE